MIEFPGLLFVGALIGAGIVGLIFGYLLTKLADRFR